MKHKKGEPPYVYIYVYIKIKEKARFNPYVSASFIFEVLRRIIRVPRILHYPILSQMEEYGMLKRINRQKYKILKSNYQDKLERLRTYEFW